MCTIRTASDLDMKRLPANTAVNNTGQAAAKLDTLLPAILNHAFNGEL